MVNKENENTYTQKQQALNISRILLDTLVHRLTNELVAVRTGISAVKDNLDDKEQLLIIINQIEKEMLRSLETVKGLQNLSASSARPEIKPVSINAIVQKVYEDYKSRGLFTERKAFLINLESDLPPAKADEKLLAEVLHNLVDNSIRAISNNRDGMIEIKSYCLNDKIAVEIRDNGPGIPPEIQAKLFLEVVRRDKNYNSLGIGLLISQSLMNSWGGNLSLVHTDSLGTTIRATLDRWHNSTEK
jgi:signal transduction histidine kinase